MDQLEPDELQPETGQLDHEPPPPVPPAEGLPDGP